MNARPQRAIPDDFREKADGMIQAELAAHYGVSVWSIKKWCDAQDDAWRAKFLAQSEARRVKAALNNVIAARDAFIVAAAKRKAERDADRAEQRGNRYKPAPEGIFDELMAMAITRIAANHGVTAGLVTRWRDDLSDDQRAKIAAAAKERHRQNCLASIAKAVEVKKAAFAVKLAERAANPKPKKTPGKGASGKNWGFTRAPELAPLTGGVVAMAAQHLRATERHVRPIVKATVVIGKDGEGFYKYGTKLVPEAFIVERAKATGFKPDGWRELVG